VTPGVSPDLAGLLLRGLSGLYPDRAAAGNDELAKRLSTTHPINRRSLLDTGNNHMTIHPPPPPHADQAGWRRPLSAAAAVLMLLVGPAAIGLATPTDPGRPASPTEQPIPPADPPPGYSPAPSGVPCPQAAGRDSGPVGGCGRAGPAATTAPTTAPTTAGPLVL